MHRTDNKHKGQLVAFVGCICTLALVDLAVHLPFGIEGHGIALFLLATLAAISGAAPVRIPGMKTSVSALDPFVFTALAALGAGPACIVSIVGVLGAAARKLPGRGLIKLAFNLGNVVVSTSFASWGFMLLGGRPGGAIEDQLWPLAVATTLYFLANTSLVTAASVLDSGNSFTGTWKETALWTAVSTYVGVMLAAGLLLALQHVGAAGLALGMPPCCLLASFYRTHKDRHEKQQDRIQQVENLNQALEDKVAERTAELQQALAHIENANATLRTANERLTEADRAKNEFLANVSHELRTPLNAIIGFSELLRDDAYGNLQADQKEYIKDIYESGEHLLSLINGILNLSKIEAGQMDVQRSPSDLQQAIREAAAMVSPQAAAKQLEVEVDCADDVKSGEVDPGMFRQVLINLLSNAVKFTNASGSVRIVARRELRDLVVEVEDSGIGISEENQQRIFDEFYQVDGSYSRSYEGTGLGLALVRRLVEMHDGTVTVRSRLGAGSCFTCRFPESLIDGEVEAELSEAPVVESAVETGQTILVVEDNPINRKLVRSVLISHGYRVLEAPTGEEALSFLTRGSADLVLMDIQLPGIDGLEVTRRLMSDPRTASLPVVALTAHARDVDEQEARDAGCVGYITKPIRVAHFPGEVGAYLTGRRAAA